MAIKEYPRGTAFPGVIGRTIGESEPAWPEPVRAKTGASNVIFIVLDDTGYGHLGCYGSPIRTPNLDRLAENGLRFTNMNTTALCSPSRSCMLTGRNHHSNAMSCITEGATGYPGGNGLIPFENGFLSEILQGHGYNTYAVGKWHLTPTEQSSAAGPYDRWPLGRGFERFYGFMGGDTHQYYPDLVYDNHQVPAPKTPEEGYHLTEDLVDRAIGFIADSKQVAPDKPFFLYFCPGAMHAPHHVPRAWADKYQGQFDDGWDAYREKVFERQLELGVVPPGTQLSARDPDVVEWNGLPADEKRLYARMMEVFAGFLEHTDHHIGRLLDFLTKTGQLDDTLIMLVSDNGASAEGGPHGSVNENLFFNNVPETAADGLKAIDDLGGPKCFNHYPWGWAWAGNAPFRRWKRETYRGGSSDPFVVHWPKGIKARGEIRSQYAHIIDMLPTVLEALGLEAPIADPRRHAVTDPGRVVRARAGRRQGPLAAPHPVLRDDGAPVHLSRRLARGLPGPGTVLHRGGDGLRSDGDHRGEAARARRQGVGALPRGRGLLGDAEPRRRQPRQADRDDRHLVRGGGQVRRAAHRQPGRGPPRRRAAAAGASPRPLRLLSGHLGGLQQDRGARAQPAAQHHRHGGAGQRRRGGAGGARGSSGGYALYVKDHKLHYAYNFLGIQQYHLASDATLSDGRHELRFEFEPTGKPDIAHGKGTPARAQLYVDGKLAGQTDLPVTIPLDIGITDGLTCGRDDGSTVTTDYQGPFAFSGALEKVVVDISGDLIEDHDARLRSTMAHQ